MTTTDAPVRLLSVVVNGTRQDLAVPALLPLAGLVSQAGLSTDDPWLSVTGNDGRHLNLADAVGDILIDGDTLVISSDRPVARALAGPWPAARRAPGEARLGVGTLAGAGVASLVQFGAALLLAHRGYSGLGSTARLVLAGLGMLTALIAGLTAATHSRPALAHVVAGLAAFTAGYSITATTMTGHTELAITAGAVACAVVSAIGRSAASERTEMASVLLFLGIVVGLSFGAALQVGGSVKVPAAILLGLVPAGYRLLPSYSIDVPDEQLIDVERLSVTAWAARTTRRQASRRIRLSEVQDAVGHAQRTVSAAVGALTVLAPVFAGVLLYQVRGGLPRWGAAIEVMLVAIALGLLPRSARSVLDKVAPRLAAAALLFELALMVAERGSAVASTLSIAALLAIGLVALISATALAGGWLSVRVSRLADALESSCVVLALPAALIAVDAISTFRQLTSG